MNQPLVSIVIPVFNCEEFIAHALSSALNQTYQNIEIWVVDDASTDNTLNAIENLLGDERVKIISLKTRSGGPAKPRNIGVKACYGDYVAFLDADDVWHPKKIEMQINALKKTNTRFCSTAMMDFENEVNFENIHLSFNYLKINFKKQLLHYSTPTSSVLIEKGLLLAHPFNESKLYIAREDLDCWLHCHEEISHSIKINCPLVGYRVNEQQISRSKIKMLYKHFRVLANYKYLNGRVMRFWAIPYTISHIAFSIRDRVILKKL